jgi:hypothetical protein
MDDEKDLSLPENNDAIPNDNPDPEVMANDMIPPEFKPEDPHFAQRIMQQLETSEMAKVSEDLILQRRYKHDAGGGEYFLLSDMNTGAEVSVSLSQIVKTKSIEELRRLLADGQ